MYDDRIEINSPGGLPEGFSKEEYLYGNISVLRNPIIASAFYRLDLIEKFGTGIMRINNEYMDGIIKLGFDKSKTLRILNNLIDKNMIQKLGKGPSTTYRLK